MDNFLIIGITPPEFLKGETERINRILSTNQAHFIHIRKPFSSIEETDKLIKGIYPQFHHRLKLHDHFELIEKYDLGGVHLNSRNPLPHPKAGSVSISLHDVNEIEKVDNFNYFFISPVFDSISKRNYKAAFDLNELSNKIKGKKAIALGGVTPDKFSILKNLCFSGAAMLGHFFTCNQHIIKK